MYDYRIMISKHGGSMHFDRLNDDAHIWVYGFDRTMSEQQRSAVEKELTYFITHWKSHGKTINGHYLILYNRFVLLGVSREQFVSGCSVDASVRIFKNIKELNNILKV